MKAVLISIHPKWCEKIASGEKTIEVRKTMPKLEIPFKVYIYETKGKQIEHVDGCDITYYGRGKVIGEFVCRGMMRPFDSLRLMAKQSCLIENELFEYSNGKTLHGWRIADLKIYDKPKELSHFTLACKFRKDVCELCCFYEEAFGGCCRTLTRPPQSWCYVEELE